VTRTLLVGSNDRWLEQMAVILELHGMRVDWWWPTPSRLGDIPLGCEAVVVATDNCSHKLSKPAMERARKAGVPLICGPHRRSALSPLLTKHGFPISPPALFGVPTLGTTSALASMPNGAVNAILDTAIDPLPAPPVAILEAILAATVPITVPVKHDPAVAALTTAARSVYDRVLPLVAAHPWLTAAELAPKMKMNSSVLLRPLRLARGTLGVTPGIGAGANRITDRARYEMNCIALGVLSVTEDVGPTRPPYTAKERNGGDRAQPGRTVKSVVPAAIGHAIVERLAALEPQPVTVVPVTVTPAPAPAPAPVTALLQGEAAKDTLEALRLLLEAMRAEGVEHVAISDDGKVSVRRRVVTTSTFAL
jgi:hypothetical protein